MTDVTESTQYLTPTEAARLLGVSARTVTRWESEGRLAPSYRTLGGHRRYAAKDVLEAAVKEGRSV